MASSIENVKLGGFKAYWGTLYLGQCHADGATITIDGNIITVQSAITGESPIKAFSGGTTVEVELTLLEFDKYVIAKFLAQAKEFATSATDGSAGKITGGYSAGTEVNAKPLYLYPTFVDTNNQPLNADSQNKYCFILFKAVPNLETEFVFSPSEETSFTINFIALADLTREEGQKIYAFGAITNPSDSVPTIT